MNSTHYSFKNLILYFLKLGTFGFGGPIALIEYMRRDLVEQHRWLTHEEYLKGLALSQLAPGPLAAQLAMYIGYVKRKVLGATLVGLAFILPSFVMVILLGVFYKHYGSLPWIQTLFYGIGPAVIAIIARSAYKLTKSTCNNRVLMWIISGIMFIITVVTGKEVVWLLLVGGIVMVLYDTLASISKSKTPFLPALIIMPLLSGGQMIRLGTILAYFLKASVVVFGSGLAVVPFLHTGVVEHYHWLNQKQFLDAIAVAMITPGPVVITVGFIGYLVEGFVGAVVAATAIFVPVWLVVIMATPYYEHIANNQGVKAFVQGITAATCGAIAGAVVILANGSIRDIQTGVIAIVTLALTGRYKISEPLLIVLAGLAGLLFLS